MSDGRGRLALWAGIGSLAMATFVVATLVPLGPIIWPAAPALGAVSLLAWVTLQPPRPRSATVGALLGGLIPVVTALLLFAGA